MIGALARAGGRAQRLAAAPIRRLPASDLAQRGADPRGGLELHRARANASPAIASRPIPAMSLAGTAHAYRAVVVDATRAAALPRPPKVVYRGFAAEGYELAQDHLLVDSLSAAYARHMGAPPSLGGDDGHDRCARVRSRRRHPVGVLRSLRRGRARGGRAGVPSERGADRAGDGAVHPGLVRAVMTARALGARGRRCWCSRARELVELDPATRPSGPRDAGARSRHRPSRSVRRA